MIILFLIKDITSKCMKRRTNLFYNFDDNNNFLTFSNYTESLTGNFLSADTKLFPSRFLCLNIDFLNGCADDTEYKHKVDALIKYFICYYENKLATLRDYYIDNNIQPEDNLNSLSYLLEALLGMKYADGKVTYDEGANNENIIQYIGEISEYDYNGTFTDIICIVDGSTCLNDNNKFKTYSINKIDYSNHVLNKFIEKDDTILHGWSEAELEGYLDGDSDDSMRPVFDVYSDIIDDEGNIDGGKMHEYVIDARICSIDEITDNETHKNLFFNAIIPLYDIIDVDYSTNNQILSSTVTGSIDVNGSFESHSNIPLGIWISDYKGIDLNINVKYLPTWSLAIGTQFKPFPYSDNDVKEIDRNQNALAFQTFAKVISKQNDLTESFNSISARLNLLERKLNDINDTVTKLNRVSTQQKVDDLIKEVNDMIVSSQNQLETYKESLKQDIEDSITWKFIQNS